VIAVAQRNILYLESLLLNVSDPSSSQYGRLLGFDAVGALVENRAATTKIVRWIETFPQARVEGQTEFGEYVTMSAPLSVINRMFRTDLKVFSSSHSVALRADNYSLPSSLASSVSAVFNLVDLPPPSIISPTVTRVSRLDGIYPLASSFVSPKRLRSAYRSSALRGSSASTQSIFATIGQVFGQDDLQAFQLYFGLDVSPVARVHNIHSANATFCSQQVDRCAEASLDVQYIMAMSPNSPTTFWYESSFADPSPFVKWLVEVASARDAPLVHSVSYGMVERFTWSALRKAFDTEAVKLGLRGVSILVASGDDGVSEFNMAGKELDQCGYYASWPASSPWVTAVGATMGGAPAGETSAERVCSSREGSAITSGGGFSEYYPQPTWQKAAVSGYFQVVQPLPENSRDVPIPGITNGFHAEKRAYPDLSLAGNNFLVMIGGSLYVVSGTSASAPALAGLISLANAARLNEGMSPLGFLNPFIYSRALGVTGDGSAGAVGVGAFAHDVVKGDNKCLRSGRCCEHVGFAAAQGWDPATGFGTVDAEMLVKAALAAGGKSTSSPSPSSQPTASPTSPAPSPPSALFFPTAAPSMALLQGQGLSAARLPIHAATGGEPAFGYAVAMAVILAVLSYLFNKGPWWTIVDDASPQEKQKGEFIIESTNRQDQDQRKDNKGGSSRADVRAKRETESTPRPPRPGPGPGPGPGGECPAL